MSKKKDIFKQRPHAWNECDCATCRRRRRCSTVAARVCGRLAQSYYETPGSDCSCYWRPRKETTDD